MKVALSNGDAIEVVTSGQQVMLTSLDSDSIRLKTDVMSLAECEDLEVALLEARVGIVCHVPQPATSPEDCACTTSDSAQCGAAIEAEGHRETTVPTSTAFIGDDPDLCKQVLIKWSNNGGLLEYWAEHRGVVTPRFRSYNGAADEAWEHIFNRPGIDGLGPTSEQCRAEVEPVAVPNAVVNVCRGHDKSIALQVGGMVSRHVQPAAFLGMDGARRLRDRLDELIGDEQDAPDAPELERPTASADVLRDPLADYVDAPTPAVPFESNAPETNKPTAEVIATFDCARIVVIDGVGFVVNPTARTSREVVRREAQRLMLLWGSDPTEVQTATQAIAE